MRPERDFRHRLCEPRRAWLVLQGRRARRRARAHGSRRVALFGVPIARKPFERSGSSNPTSCGSGTVLSAEQWASRVCRIQIGCWIVTHSRLCRPRNFATIGESESPFQDRGVVMRGPALHHGIVDRLKAAFQTNSGLGNAALQVLFAQIPRTCRTVRPMPRVGSVLLQAGCWCQD